MWHEVTGWERRTIDNQARAWLGFSTPWGAPGIPVLVDRSAAWPPDEWAYVVDGVKVAGGHGVPTVRHREIAPPVIDPKAMIRITGI